MQEKLEVKYSFTQYYSVCTEKKHCSCNSSEKCVIIDIKTYNGNSHL